MEDNHKPSEQASVDVVLVIGQTFVYRRELRRLGAKWNSEEGGWVVPLVQKKSIEELAEGKHWTLSEIKVNPVALETPTGDRLRAIRQAKLDRKVERIRAHAERLQKEAGGKMAAFEEYRHDIAFVTQPGHIPFREKVMRRYEKGLEMVSEALELEKKADWLERGRARIAGDAERARQAKRDELDKLVSVGSRVYDFSFGEGTVVKVNKKSYSVKYDRSGSTCARDKSYFKVLRGEEGAS